MVLDLSNPWLPLIGALSILLCLAGCAAAPESGEVQIAAATASGRGVDDLVLVDCLLPGQIRQLGTRMTYLAPRRLVKSTKSECAIRGGEFVLFDRSDYASALEALLPKARAGDPLAQTYVGEIYEKGLGLPAPDYASAADWYRRAAEQNHGPAQIALGSLYERGLGVATDKAKALDLYRRASGLSDDRLIFESTLKAQREDFQRELAVRNRVAAALRAQLRQSKNPRPSGGGAASGVDPEQLRRQAESQRLDAQSEAERIQRELHAIEQLKRSEPAAPADSGKAAQLGKLELTRREQYRSLLDTSRQLSQAQ